MNSGFQVLDSRLLVSDLDSGLQSFEESGFKIPGFRIPEAKHFQIPYIKRCFLDIIFLSHLLARNSHYPLLAVEHH